jgi:hypothetical protein
MTFDEACVALASRTGMDRDSWSDFLNCTPSQQAALAQAYKHCRWAQSRDTLADVLSLLGVAATVAGDLSGVGSAYAVLKAL